MNVFSEFRANNDEFIHLPATIPEINKALSRMGDDIIQQYEVHHFQLFDVGVMGNDGDYEDLSYYLNEFESTHICFLIAIFYFN